MNPAAQKPFSLRTTLAGLLAGASLTALALGLPSHAVNLEPSPTVVAGTAATPSANLADIVERVSPSVVQIVVRQGSPLQRVSTPGDELPPELREFFGPNFRRFFEEQQNFPREMPDRVGSGSGFFIDGGFIVTNNHVVDNARKLRVRLDTGKEVDGTLVGTDSKTDLAVVKIDPRHARKPLTWGDSNQSRPGDNVFTIGAPFSLGNTVTAGIISARGRDINSGPYDDYFQIDAPINPGNSGGPMFNANGEVIGVNTAIFSPSGGNVGIGFSIPAEQAKAVVKQIIDKGFVERGWLGVNIQRVTPEIAQSLGLTDAKGALIGDVTPDSPAAKAGLRAMDLVTAYGGHPINNIHDLTRAVADTRPGEYRELRVRRDGAERTLTVRIAAVDSPAAPTTSAKASSTDILKGGLGLEIARDERGLVIADVVSGSAAEDAGLKAGDRLLMVNQMKVSTAKDMQAAVDMARRTGRPALLLQVERSGAKLFVGVQLKP
jgi:serine protease Do